MKTKELNSTIKEFLDLMESPAPDPERTLKLLLDELALASHGPRPTSSGRDGDAPRRDYNELRAQVAARFPNYGLYRAAGTDPEDELLVGDAIDDITDIAIELSEVSWLFQHAGESAARWMFHLGFDTHWGSHLRSLQWYAHELATQS